MRVCGKCDQEMPDEAFAWKITGKRRNSYCKPCHKVYRGEYYAQNKDRLQVKNKEWKLAQKRIFYEWLALQSCVDCGLSDIRVLEFDHTSDDKEFNMAKMIGNRTLESLRNEINKCDIVCANCHRIRTATRGNWFTYLSS